MARSQTGTRINNVVRPKDLPEFANPPLNEVYFGVQFQAIRGWLQIHAAEVWKIFRDKYPRLEEQPLLVPQFETFGLPGPQQISLIPSPVGTRHWFLTDTKDELIQFQPDRLFHNWRKLGNKGEYPRFETMIEKFEAELSALRTFVRGAYDEDLTITQCEISYVNHIYEKNGNGSAPGDWLNVLNFTGLTPEMDPDDFNLTFRERLEDNDGKPLGRLICEANTAFDRKGRQLIALTITARGAPLEATEKSALEFLRIGREMVVRLFSRVTTDSAHKIWGRTQ